MKPNHHHQRRLRIASSAKQLSVTISVIACVFWAAASAHAGTYPMYQCSPGTETVSHGWETFGYTTDANAVLTNSCATGGWIGDYVFSNNEVGAVTESGSSGSTVGLSLGVPVSDSTISIQGVSAEVIGSSVSGNDAYMEFSSDGQSLPGGYRLAYEGATSTATDSWTLPEGARNFDLYVNCSTDHSSPTCRFAEPTAVPALRDVTLTLLDNARPAFASLGGALAQAAAGKATVSGIQQLEFDAEDLQAGLLSATLTLQPQGGGEPFTHTFDWSSECRYASWNACPTSQTGSYALNTALLKDGTYTVALSLSNAAGDTTSRSLGSVITDNAPVSESPPMVLAPGGVVVGTTLSAQPGQWSASSEAGTIAFSYQWQQCDAEGAECRAIANAENSTYTPAPADVGRALRVLVTAADNDGHAVATSAVSAVVAAPAGSLGAEPGSGSSLTSPITSAPSLAIGPSTPPNAPAGSVSSQASSKAVIYLGIARHVTRSFARRAFAIRGRLVTVDGSPIAYAPLEVMQNTPRGRQVIYHAMSTGNGTFMARIPAGASRTILIGYKIDPHQHSYSALAEVQEVVRAGVRLKIAPRRTGPSGTIVLFGRVLGKIPRHGVIVDLLVHYRGRWVPFRTPRTGARGRFKVAYQFQGAVGRFPFFARVPGDQAGFAYSVGQSGLINVNTR